MLLPRDELTVTMWVRMDSDVSSAGCLLSFFADPGVQPVTAATNNTALLATPEPLPSYYYEFALLDPRSLRVAVRERTDLTWREPALHTHASLNDGEWNHIAVTWRSSDGAATVYRNGQLVFSTDALSTGGHGVGRRLAARGTIVVGQAVVGPAVHQQTPVFAPGMGFVGEIQNVRVYRRVLGSHSGIDGILADMRWPFGGAGSGAPVGHQHLLLYWRFSSAFFAGTLTGGNGATASVVLSNTPVTNLASPVDPNALVASDPEVLRQQRNYTGTTSVTGVSIGGGAAAALQALSSSSPSSSLLPSSSAVALSPCVEDAVWYFSTPADFFKPATPGGGDGGVRAVINGSSSLVEFYDGRLQFEMMQASSAGVLRSARGAVEIYSEASPYVISHLISDELLPPHSSGGSENAGSDPWSRFSVVLREDMGWVREPSGSGPLTTEEMRTALGSATAIRIRGDAFVCDATGDGREAVYVNHVRLESAAAQRVQALPDP